MGITLKVAPEELEGTAAEVSGRIALLKENLNTMDKSVEGSLEYWEGTGNETHQEKYRKLRKTFDAAVELVDRKPNILLEMAGLYRAAEAANVEATGCLSSDVIS